VSECNHLYCVGTLAYPEKNDGKHMCLYGEEKNDNDVVTNSYEFNIALIVEKN